MKTTVINKFGDVSVFESTEQAIPAPGPGQVLIKVMATSYNPVDGHLREGHMGALPGPFPIVLHGDVAGIVEATGADVKGFKKGDHVYGWTGGFGHQDGALSEFMRADQRLLARMPANLSFSDAAAIPLVALTAYEALFERVKIDAGQKVLIYGGVGGVGHLALQFAKLAGAEVYAVVSRDEQIATARSFGADHVINYNKQSVAEYVQRYTDGTGFDIVFDTVGGANHTNSFAAVKPFGNIISTIAMAPQDLSPLHLKAVNFHVVFLVIPIAYNMDVRQQAYGRNLARIAEWVEQGKVNVLVDERKFSFEEVAAAHEYAASGQSRGKVVIAR
ncbi:zinc-dependent alcohol dehydrogenase family protein [Chitinophaga filiformis]|uniref:zinc-dependent alcohol dehydrogenase family protein n=1 Tax=Chitinophaga filiformis TaxID=104663 RepID=UPI001F47A8A9|nr:zinc-dependent alcohol dehydrogenase family protein [Chitinophaga filiformis]MCF6402509.1 zinc-dependent alcohol dehydrogenase family protein [Chitinophaga filiformis]